MIKYYFALQHKIIQRHMIEWGIKPFITYPLILFTFIFLSYLFYSKVVLPAEAYSLGALFIISGLSASKRIEFYKTIFIKAEFNRIRLIENLICIFPFSVFLILKLEWMYAIFIFCISAILSQIHFGIPLGKAIPTPFSTSPFEFPVGIRRTFPFVLLAYAVTGIGLKVGNFNLAAFSLGLIFFIILSYYFFLEKPEYVWIHAQRPGNFLLRKIKMATINALLLCIPTLLMLVVFQSDRLWTILLIFMVSQLFLITMILSKYTGYPREMNVPNGILIGLSFFFPPLLLALIPYFYNQSILSLNKILA